MSVVHNVYIGRYIKVKSWYASITSKEIIHSCSNDVCKNHFLNKNLEKMNFCPECGSKVIPIEVDFTNLKRLDLNSICEELFGVDVFNCDDQYIFYDEATDCSKTVSGDYEFDLSEMFEYMKNKNAPDDVDILSNYLTKLGIENEIKFGAVGYYC